MREVRARPHGSRTPTRPLRRARAPRCPTAGRARSKPSGSTGLRVRRPSSCDQGRPPVGLEEIAVAGETMAMLGVAVGDRIELTGGCGTRSAEVVGEAIVPIVDQGDPGEGIVLSLEGFDALCADQLAAADRPNDRPSLAVRGRGRRRRFAAELVADGAFVDRRFVPPTSARSSDLAPGADRRRASPCSASGSSPSPTPSSSPCAGGDAISVCCARSACVRRRRRQPSGGRRRSSSSPRSSASPPGWSSGGRCGWPSPDRSTSSSTSTSRRCWSPAPGRRVVRHGHRPGHRPGPAGRPSRPRPGPAERVMAMAWMTARAEWRRRTASLALLAVLVTLAGGVTIGAAAGARRADSAFEPLRRRDRGAGRAGRRLRQSATHGRPSRATRRQRCWTRRRQVPGVISVQRMAAMAVAATQEADAFAFAFAEQRGDPGRPFMVEGRMFDPDEPDEVVVNEAAVVAFDVALGERLVLETVGWDELDVYFEQDSLGGRRDGPQVEVTVVGVHAQRHRRRPAGRPVRHTDAGLPRALRGRGDPLRLHRPVRRRGWSGGAHARAARPPVRTRRLGRRPGGGGRAARARRQRHRRRGRRPATARPGLRDRRADRRRPGDRPPGGRVRRRSRRRHSAGSDVARSTPSPA